MEERAMGSRAPTSVEDVVQDFWGFFQLLPSYDARALVDISIEKYSWEFFFVITSARTALVGAGRR
jgi:hypothetical protein